MLVVQYTFGDLIERDPEKMVTLCELKQGAVLATKFITVLSTSLCSADKIPRYTAPL